MGEGAPLAYMQEFLSAGKRQAPNPGWNMLLPWRLRGPLDTAALVDGLSEVVGRHEVLRTTFGGANGRAEQIVHPAAPVPVADVDLTSMPPTEREAELARLARGRHAIPFDHARGPLLTSTLVRTAEDEHYLLTTIDHAVCDGWSIGVILAELAAFYNGTVTGRGRRIWALPGQYAGFARQQRRLADDGAYDRDLDYWRERLTAAPVPLGLGVDAAPAEGPGYRSGQHPLAIPAEVVAPLRALGQRQRVTLFMIVLAALAASLARHTEDGEVAVTTLVAGRKRVEHQRLVGMFANPVVLRVSVAGAASFAELLDRVRRTVLAGYGRQETPFPLVAERAGVRAAEIWLNVAPPPALARFRNLDVDTQALPRDYPIDVPAAAWHGERLICNLTDTGTEIVGLLDHNTHLLEQSTVEGLADALLHLLHEAARDPATPLPPIGTRGPLYAH